MNSNSSCVRVKRSVRSGTNSPRARAHTYLQMISRRELGSLKFLPKVYEVEEGAVLRSMYSSYDRCFPVP